jgi:hypothetical protein
MDGNYTVKEVAISEDGWIHIMTTESTGFGLDPKYQVMPEVGDTVTLYTKNFSEVRGVDLNRRTIFYKTDQCLELEREEWLENYRLEKLATFTKQEAKLDRDYSNLPLAFKKRITRFRKESADFRVDSEGYEMFCCTEAVKIAEYCKTPEAVVAFKEDPWDKQKEAGIEDGHSGNTFGGACNLAYNYLNGMEL